MSIVKEDLPTRGASAILPDNPIRMSDLPVDMSKREITEGCDSTNFYFVPMGLYAP